MYLPFKLFAAIIKESQISSLSGAIAKFTSPGCTDITGKVIFDAWNVNINQLF